MKVGIYQFDVKFGDKKRNLQKVKNTLEATEFDLMVLPECFNSGYLFENQNELKELAEEIPNGETTELLSEIAKRKNAYIVGGIPEMNDGAFYNSAVIVGPNGYIEKYRKIHLPNFEKEFFQSGNEICIFEIDNIKVGVIICFDAWFPELTRILTQKGVDIICHCANFGAVWSIDAIKTRALENVVYIISANRCGKENRAGVDAVFRGESQIVSPDAEILYSATGNDELKIIEIDPLRSRKKSNVICDDMFTEINKYEVNLKK